MYGAGSAVSLSQPSGARNVSCDRGFATDPRAKGTTLPPVRIKEITKRAGARAARVAGAHVVLLDGEAALFVERGGRSLVPLRDPDATWLRPAPAYWRSFTKSRQPGPENGAWRKPSGLSR